MKRLQRRAIVVMMLAVIAFCSVLLGACAQQQGARQLAEDPQNLGLRPAA